MSLYSARVISADTKQFELVGPLNLGQFDSPENRGVGDGHAQERRRRRRARLSSGGRPSASWEGARRQRRKPPFGVPWLVSVRKPYLFRASWTARGRASASLRRAPTCG